MTDQVTIEDYRRQLQALLPQGPAWPRDSEVLLSSLINGLAAEFANVHNRDLELLQEMIPLTTVEMLPDWERVAGLPDACTGGFDTIDQRRRAVLVKLAARGGQSPDYFVELASVFGWTIEITEYRRFRAGSSAAGDALTNDQGDDYGWVYVWKVKSDSPVTYFRAGAAAVGEPLASWGNDPLECMLNRFKPAHTRVIFDYS